MFIVWIKNGFNLAIGFQEALGRPSLVVVVVSNLSIGIIGTDVVVGMLNVDIIVVVFINDLVVCCSEKFVAVIFVAVRLSIIAGLAAVNTVVVGVSPCRSSIFRT